MRWLILCLAVTSVTALKLQNAHPCDDKECKAGRECVVVEEEAQCLCVVECPDHFKPVCGTDGVSYDNHCKLHQRACLSEHPISIKHKGFCKKKSFDKHWKKDKKKSLLSKGDLEEELQNDLIKLLKKQEKKADALQHKKGPAVCYAPQRNALRFLLVEHWEEDLKTQAWYLEGTTYRESLWGWFFSCDTDKDNFLTPEELLACSQDVAFFARPGQDNQLTKALCIDALIDDGDKNRDWRLDFEEFTTIMDPKYEPKEKKCSLEGKSYLDGEEINVDCNQCVCGVGNWVCASTDCDETAAEEKKKKKKKKTKSQHHTSIGNLDNDIEELIESLNYSNDVLDSPAPVADVWMDNNRKDKGKAKKSTKEAFDVDDNLFLDFDLGNDDAKKEEEDEEDDALELDDYYDDLFEKTKTKPSKKKKFQLNKALEEVKKLMKETKHLKDILSEQKDSESTEEKKTSWYERKANKKEDKAAKVSDRKQYFKKEEKKKKQPFHHKQHKSNSFYDDIFKNTDWDNLIDWGKLKSENAGFTNDL